MKRVLNITGALLGLMVFFVVVGLLCQASEGVDTKPLNTNNASAPSPDVYMYNRGRGACTDSASQALTQMQYPNQTVSSLNISVPPIPYTVEGCPKKLEYLTIRIVHEVIGAHVEFTTRGRESVIVALPTPVPVFENGELAVLVQISVPHCIEGEFETRLVLTGIHQGVADCLLDLPYATLVLDLVGDPFPATRSIRIKVDGVYAWLRADKWLATLPAARMDVLLKVTDRVIAENDFLAGLNRYRFSFFGAHREPDETKLALDPGSNRAVRVQVERYTDALHLAVYGVDFNNSAASEVSVGIVRGILYPAKSRHEDSFVLPPMWLHPCMVEDSMVPNLFNDLFRIPRDQPELGDIVDAKGRLLTDRFMYRNPAGEYARWNHQIDRILVRQKAGSAALLPEIGRWGTSESELHAAMPIPGADNAEVRIKAPGLNLSDVFLVCEIVVPNLEFDPLKGNPNEERYATAPPSCAIGSRWLDVRKIPEDGVVRLTGLPPSAEWWPVGLASKITLTNNSENTSIQRPTGLVLQQDSAQELLTWFSTLIPAEAAIERARGLNLWGHPKTVPGRGLPQDCSLTLHYDFQK